MNKTHTGTTSFLNIWSEPKRVRVNEAANSIEMIYKQTSMISSTGCFSSPPEVRVFKIVYRCVKGKWNKSEPKFGKIVAAQDEYYEF